MNAKMGGVPYKSKGCNTCRRRKVRCDETKPECMRCVKNGHECLGYERRRVFIQGASKTSHTLAHRPRDPPAEQSSSSETSSSSSPEADSDIPWFDVNPETRIQFVANFVDCFEPSAVIRDGKYRTFTHLQDTFPGFVGSSPVLDKAATALSAAFLAKTKQNNDLLTYSTRLYGQILQTVHSRIRSGRKCGQDLLFATVIFQIYELVNCSPLGFRAWLAHVQGSNAILAQYNSPSPLSVTEHLFRRQLKFVTVCDAVGMRKSAYNYSQFWQNPPPENPWREPVDIILDSIMECSSLMEQVDSLIQSGDPSVRREYEKGEQLLGSCLSFKDQLDIDFRGMQKVLGIPWSFPQQEPFWSELDHTIPQDIFPDAIDYPSLTCSESHLLWWTTFILLYPLIDELLIFLGRPRSNVQFTLWDVPPSYDPAASTTTLVNDLPEDVLAVAEHYANLICRSAKFLVQPQAKGMGAQILLAPFSQATQFYHSRGATDKHRWCQTVFMCLPKLGFGIAPFLKDMIWPKYEVATAKKAQSSSPESAESSS
ncbi:uncharacterized protein N7496_009655 [Penicillium cataractarum]|uniref:Zn(2)-C6 fungal-type domain-containing protein n=1 Tax=Penicillium cataractarum TaxID=2100454 RepID=A0A9W9V054_9EURO|nr:uncharacterized protein N7496_009655 [Penicillium cataractarum]KAJ5363942.1 hypothetical protein N7496_009655 [Penicillium cataractarum]